MTSAALKSLYDQAAQRHGRGNLAGAEEVCREILALEPADARAYHMLGVIRYQQGKSDEALEHLNTALAADPGAVGPRIIQGVVLQAMGRLQEALASFEQALALKPDNVTALNNRGNLLLTLDRPAEAAESFAAILASEPDNEVVLFNRGLALAGMRRYAEAMASFDRALARKPEFPAAWNHRGQMLLALERPQDALISFNRALATEPGNIAVLYSRGLVLRQLKRYDEALASFDQALKLAPDNYEALAARGYLLWDRFRRYEPAVRDLDRAIRIKPDTPYARGDLLHLKMLGADWRGLGQEMAFIDEGVRAGQKVIRPFAYQALSASPADLQAAAAIFTRDVFPTMPALSRGGEREHRKIRLGYVCGAFSEHALAYLAVGLYELHDRRRFEVIALDAGRNDASAIRARLEAAFDKIIDISGMSDAAAAERVRAEEIDILINVDGYSGNMRMGVFSRRPAPVQVNWLGFPGTLGADYMDYIIADTIVIPEEEQVFLTEQVVYLPNAYQVNDAGRPIAETPRRAEHGLPEQAFVFCNFNQSYKITPEAFGSFLRVMREVESSVLWLLEANATFQRNLKAEAERHDVGGERLIFAPIIPATNHLARLALADLFLDSWPYNAHTTCSDALWAGLPLITMRGTAFAGRVATSLLRAMGVPELVAESREEFEALALNLAQDTALLKSFRDRIAASRATAPLFKTDLYRRHIEAAYERMWSGRGRPPQGFSIGDD